MTRRLWTRDELILALNLYLKLPFGKLHSNTPEIIHLAKLINRTPGSVAMRLNNFASVDPYHQKRGITGLQGGRKQVEPIWGEFAERREELLFESEKILAQLENTTIEMKFRDELSGVDSLTGQSKVREVKTRVNQSVFRQIVLANYSSTCAFSGINIRPLLIASHIVPWSENAKERLNPENGICLSALYDKAFDKGLMGISVKYEILISNELSTKEDQNYFARYFGHLKGKTIKLPPKYYPKREFLEYHLENIYRQ